MTRLTVEAIRKYPKPVKRRRVADSAARGLYLYIEVSGIKRWVLRYKAPSAALSVQHKHTLGYWAEPPPSGRNPSGYLSLAEARSVAQSWRDRLRRGEYPHLVEAREREILEASQKARGAAPTVAELAALFRDRYLVTNTRRPASRLIAFNKWVAPELPDGLRDRTRKEP